MYYNLYSFFFHVLYVVRKRMGRPIAQLRTCVQTKQPTGLFFPRAKSLRRAPRTGLVCTYVCTLRACSMLVRRRMWRPFYSSLRIYIKHTRVVDVRLLDHDGVLRCTMYEIIHYTAHLYVYRRFVLLYLHTSLRRSALL